MSIIPKTNEMDFVFNVSLFTMKKVLLLNLINIDLYCFHFNFKKQSNPIDWTKWNNASFKLPQAIDLKYNVHKSQFDYSSNFKHLEENKCKNFTIDIIWNMGQCTVHGIHRKIN